MKLWTIDYRRRTVTGGLEQDIRDQEAPSLKAAKELAKRTADAEGWEWATVVGRATEGGAA